MRSLLPLVLLLAASFLLRAEDWTTVDGKTFKNVKVLSHGDGYVTIMDDDGGAKVMLTELPAPLRARFGFDPVKASACVAATEASDEKEQAALDAEKRRQDAAAAGASPFGTPSVPAATSTPSVAVQPAPKVVLPANTLLNNGDFSHGDAQWLGDGVFSPADRGLRVRLNSSAWTAIYQEFSGDKGTRYSLDLTYRLSTDFAPSKDPADYTEIGRHIGVPGFEHFGSITGRSGNFYGTIGDTSAPTIACEIFDPKLGTNEVQTYHHDYPAIPAAGNDKVAVAFPPGSGTVVVLSVAVTSK